VDAISESHNVTETRVDWTHAAAAAAGGARPHSTLKRIRSLDGHRHMWPPPPLPLPLPPCNLLWRRRTTDDGMRRGDDGIGDRSTALRGGRGRRCWTSRLGGCAIVPLLLMLLCVVGLSHGSDQSPRSTGK